MSHDQHYMSQSTLYVARSTLYVAINTICRNQHYMLQSTLYVARSTLYVASTLYVVRSTLYVAINTICRKPNTICHPESHQSHQPTLKWLNVTKGEGVNQKNDVTHLNNILCSFYAFCFLKDWQFFKRLKNTCINAVCFTAICFIAPILTKN